MRAKRAALGIQMHSGWGVLVAVCWDERVLEILERRRITVIDPAMAGATQPYHHARLQLDTRGLEQAERHIADCASNTERLSISALESVLASLRNRGYRVAGSAVLLSAGRPLPDLPKILGSHPMIHTAEGEFFSQAVRNTCERLHIPVVGIRKRDLVDEAKKAFGKSSARVQRTIAGLGKSIGPPWKADHKTAALAAATVLQRH